MKKINIVSLCLIILGILAFLLDGGFGIPSIFSKTDAGFIAVGVGYPLIAIGIILLIIGLFIKKK